MNLLRLEQIVTEDKYSKYNLFNKLKSELPNDLLDIVVDVIKPVCMRRHIPELEVTATNVVVMLLTITGTQLLTVLASKLANKLDLPRIEAVAASAALLAVIAKDTHYIIMSLRGEHIIIESNLSLTPRVKEILVESECLPPFLVRPQTIKSNFTSGHITLNKPLILTKFKVHNHQQNLHFINTVNATKLSLNKYMLGFLEEPKETNDSAFKFHVEVSNKAYEYVLNHNNEYYLSHNYDTRGRVYCDSWQCNYQGTDYKKSLTMLANSEVVTNIDWVKISIANAYGIDNLTWQERLDWVAKQPKLLKLVAIAKEPYQYLAAVQALNLATTKRPTGYMVGLDACSSGIQIMAICSGDLVAAKYCGLIDTGSREDIYQSILDDMKLVEYTRKDIKGAGMETMYGSRTAPKRLFGDESTVNAFYKELVTKLPKCVHLLKVLLGSHSETATEYKWTLPDGHVACVPVMNNTTYNIVLDELGRIPFTHRIRENRPTDYDVSNAAK